MAGKSGTVNTMANATGGNLWRLRLKAKMSERILTIQIASIL